ncbi:MAG: hypothetical protein U9N08_01210 [Candidatus Caldatribacteriota bacterium]|nr:hypothetical protein [Candidatus Caldatribacteriota bacterium]
MTEKKKARIDRRDAYPTGLRTEKKEKMDSRLLGNDIKPSILVGQASRLSI